MCKIFFKFREMKIENFCFKADKKVLFLLFLLFGFFSFNFSLSDNKNLKGSVFIDTFVIKGPDLVIEDNNVTFEIQGYDYLNQSKYFYFQTQLWPIEKEWQTWYSSKKSYYNLPKGPNFYIFKARAINDKGQYDLSPVSYYFYTKISPFYKDISIYPFYDALGLSLSNFSNKEIKVSNWRIKSTLIDFRIPKAVKDYHPNPNLRKEEEIVLKPSDKLVISAVYDSVTSSPGGLIKVPLSPLGINFLGNKCFIYINKNYPDLNYPVYYCDSLNLSSEELLNMVLRGQISRSCAVKIQNLGCGPLTSYVYQKFKDDFYCLGIAEDWFNYNSCYQRNRNSKDFFGSEWRVYFDPRSQQEKQDRKPLGQIFQKRFEKIRLEDENGLLVNEYNFY